LIIGAVVDTAIPLQLIIVEQDRMNVRCAVERADIDALQTRVGHVESA
jgi:hypothetical protein